MKVWNRSHVNVLWCLCWSLSIFLVVRSEEECIAPDALEACRLSLEQTELHCTSSLESREMTLIREWSDKLNNAVEEAVQTSRLEWKKECEESKQGHLVVLQEEWSKEVSVLKQELQQQQIMQESLIQEHKKHAGEDLEKKVRLALENAQREHAAALDNAQREHSAALENAHREHSAALENAQRGHSAAYSKLEHAKSLLEKEVIALRGQATESQRSYQRVTKDLLEARKELLEAHQTVRLFHAGFYNRWIFWPLGRYLDQLYHKFLVPLASDLYVAGKPIWDPVLDQFLRPHVFPVVTLVWKFLYDFWEPVLQDFADVMIFFWSRILVPGWNHVRLKTPGMMQTAGNVAAVKIFQIATILWAKGVPLFRQASQVYHAQVVPKLMPTWKLVVEFYNERVIPFYFERIVPVWKDVVKAWNLHAIPVWKKWYPIVVHNFKSFRSIAAKQWQMTVHPTFHKLYVIVLHQWVRAGTVLETLAKKQHWPLAIQDAAKYMHKNPKRSLEQVCTVFFISCLFLLLVTILWPQRSQRKKKAVPSTKKNGVHYGETIISSPSISRQNMKQPTKQQKTPLSAKSYYKI